MNNLKNSIVKHRTKYLIVIAILLSLTGMVSYGYFTTAGKQEAPNIIRVNKCLSITLVNESDSISLTNEYPITDIKGLDKTPYTFTIQNECDEPSPYEINLESINKQDNYLPSSYVKVALASDTNENLISILSDNEPAAKYVNGSYEAYNLYTGTLPANSTKDFEFREWIDYATTKEQQNKTYESKINVVANPDLEVEEIPEIKFSNDGYNTLTGIITGSANTAKYCYSTSNVCESNINLSISNNKTTIQITEDNNENMLCISLNEDKQVCTNRIIADFKSPNIIVTVNNNNTHKPSLTIISNETGHYCVNKSQSTDDMNDCIKSGSLISNTSITTTSITTSDTYYVHAKDTSGNHTISYAINIFYNPDEMISKISESYTQYKKYEKAINYLSSDEGIARKKYSTSVKCPDYEYEDAPVDGLSTQMQYIIYTYNIVNKTWTTSNSTYNFETEINFSSVYEVEAYIDCKKTNCSLMSQYNAKPKMSDGGSNTSKIRVDSCVYTGNGGSYNTTLDTSLKAYKNFWSNIYNELRIDL